MNYTKRSIPKRPLDAGNNPFRRISEHCRFCWDSRLPSASGHPRDQSLARKPWDLCQAGQVVRRSQRLRILLSFLTTLVPQPSQASRGLSSTLHAPRGQFPMRSDGWVSPCGEKTVLGVNLSEPETCLVAIRMG